MTKEELDGLSGKQKALIRKMLEPSFGMNTDIALQILTKKEISKLLAIHVQAFLDTPLTDNELIDLFQNYLEKNDDTPDHER